MPSVPGAPATVSGPSHFEKVSHRPANARSGHSSPASEAGRDHVMERHRKYPAGAWNDPGRRGCHFQVYSVAKVSQSSGYSGRKVLN